MLVVPIPTMTPEVKIAQIMSHYRRQSPLDALDASLAMVRGDTCAEVEALLDGLDSAWADYAVASVYAALMGSGRRKALGAYFTPPGLVRYLLSRASAFGVDLTSQRIRDPAAGGAAFIVPIAREMVRRWRSVGLDDEAVVNKLTLQLMGREIDPGLACLANALLRRCLVDEYGFSETLASTVDLIAKGDTLAVRNEEGADHEIGNPPFLRLTAKDEPTKADQFADISSGRLNLYSIFVRRGLDALPPGGILAYIIPASFIGGSEFRRFRLRVRQLADVLAVDLIDSRKSVFTDVVQDTCVLVLRKRETELLDVDQGEAASNTVGADGVHCSSGKVQMLAGTGAWVLPGLAADLPSNLAGWGYAARVGYLVPTRQSDRLHAEYSANRVPLIWAKAIGQDGTFDFERGAQFKKTGWVDAPLSAPYVAKTGCVAVQRTSARGQKRRISAAEIPAEFVQRHGGIVAENHVILLLPTRTDAASPADLARALNLPGVGEQLDRMCGSASIPARLLEQVPLPHPPVGQKR